MKQLSKYTELIIHLDRNLQKINLGKKASKREKLKFPVDIHTYVYKNDTSGYNII